jgi:hypothetical protein
MSESDFFKTKPQTPTLLKLLKPHHPDFSSKKLTIEALHKKLFSSQTYDKSNITNLLHDATALTEKFLLLEELKNNDRDHDRLIRKIYLERNLFKDYQLASDRFLKQLQKQTHREPIDFLNLWEVYSNRYFRPNQIKTGKKSDDIMLATDALD